MPRIEVPLRGRSHVMFLPTSYRMLEVLEASCASRADAFADSTVDPRLRSLVVFIPESGLSTACFDAVRIRRSCCCLLRCLSSCIFAPRSKSIPSENTRNSALARAAEALDPRAAESFSRLLDSISRRRTISSLSFSPPAAAVASRASISSSSRMVQGGRTTTIASARICPSITWSLERWKSGPKSAPDFARGMNGTITSRLNSPRVMSEGDSTMIFLPFSSSASPSLIVSGSSVPLMLVLGLSSARTCSRLSLQSFTWCSTTSVVFQEL
mmetsp:Transcript_55613/g.127185  ORF Transcript_55613/g.127185 Transcript_55613/m.127185 type:complete len:270 (+) Transcript_55613:332-1141(+)